VLESHTSVCDHCFDRLSIALCSYFGYTVKYFMGRIVKMVSPEKRVHVDIELPDF